MSSRTPAECVELALDDSAPEDERGDAIHALKMANECDELEALVREEQLGDALRHRALQALGTPQCAATLRELDESGGLTADLQAEVDELVREQDDK